MEVTDITAEVLEARGRVAPPLLLVVQFLVLRDAPTCACGPDDPPTLAGFQDEYVGLGMVPARPPRMSCWGSLSPLVVSREPRSPFLLAFSSPYPVLATSAPGVKSSGNLGPRAVSEERWGSSGDHTSTPRPHVRSNDDERVIRQRRVGLRHPSGAAERFQRDL